jgi:uncharacterized protein (TIGR03435 family)
LLAERFHLTFHRETRELPVFALSVAKGGPSVVRQKSCKALSKDFSGQSTWDRLG